MVVFNEIFAGGNRALPDRTQSEARMTAVGPAPGAPTFAGADAPSTGQGHQLDQNLPDTSQLGWNLTGAAHLPDCPQNNYTA